VLVEIDDSAGVRTLTLNRPEALNAFNEALYDATTIALRAADDDPDVAVILLTGSGRAFSAGNDLVEMAARVGDPDFVDGEFGFRGFIDTLTGLRKPLILAINGLGVGIGATIIGFGDLVFMASTAKVKCPFTSLGVAPEAASSYLLPALIGRQNASWMLLSSEWIEAQEALRMGLVWRVCAPEDLLAEARRHAEVLAAKPIPSLIAVKETIMAPKRPEILAAAEREYAQFEVLLGAAANADALAAFADRKSG
jgi:enoyl-CoA hydratase/carnithine racemase